MSISFQRSRNKVTCPSGRSCQPFVPDRTKCSTAAYAAVQGIGSWKSKTNVKTATISVDLGAVFLRGHSKNLLGSV